MIWKVTLFRHSCLLLWGCTEFLPLCVKKICALVSKIVTRKTVFLPVSVTPLEIVGLGLDSDSDSNDDRSRSWTRIRSTWSWSWTSMFSTTQNHVESRLLITPPSPSSLPKHPLRSPLVMPSWFSVRKKRQKLPK